MSDSFQGRLSEAMKTSVVDIAIPMHLKGKENIQNQFIMLQDGIIKFWIMLVKFTEGIQIMASVPLLWGDEKVESLIFWN